VSKELRLRIGDMALALTSGGDGCQFQVEPVYESFRTDDEPEVVLRVHYGAAPQSGFVHSVFDSGGPWSLHRDCERWVIRVRSPALGPEPYLTAVMEPDFRTGDIYMAVRHAGADLPRNPLGYPLAQVLMIALLSLGRGVLVHACGVNDRGRGFVFCGKSGDGKSTMARLWEGQDGTSILNDDRIILRERGEGLWAYGTPWHGDAQAYCPEGVPVDAIFFIRHGEDTCGVRLRPQEAVCRLLVRSFPTFWSAEGMSFTLELLGRVSRRVPCYDLPFLPDKNILEFVRSMDLK
jgi:hypothetical protein